MRLSNGIAVFAIPRNHFKTRYQAVVLLEEEQRPFYDHFVTSAKLNTTKKYQVWTPLLPGPSVLALCLCTPFFCVLEVLRVWPLVVFVARTVLAVFARAVGRCASCFRYAGFYALLACKNSTETTAPLVDPFLVLDWIGFGLGGSLR